MDGEITAVWIDALPKRQKLRPERKVKERSRSSANCKGLPDPDRGETGAKWRSPRRRNKTASIRKSTERKDVGWMRE